MSRKPWIVLCIAMAGCGGGGGASSSTVTITGQVVSIETGNPLNPAAQVEAGTSGVTTLTALADGSFSLTGSPSGTSNLRVDPRNSSPLFVYSIAPATAQEDVGTLYVGPQQISASGRVVDSTTGNAIRNAVVNFGGARGLTDSSGTYHLTSVPYSPSSTSLFPTLNGSVTASGYFLNTFNASGNVPSAGLMAFNDVQLVPLSNPNPPSTPYNIWGRLSPSNLGVGAVVTLKSGGVAIRQVTVDASSTYYFWVPAGTYTISFQSGTQSSADQSVTLPSSDTVVEKDATLG